MQPIVATPLGPVRGREQDGVRRFLGIPYAAPPVGRAALRAARAASRLDASARDAVAFGPAPLQPADGLSQTLGLLGDHPQSEDCLDAQRVRARRARGRAAAGAGVAARRRVPDRHRGRPRLRRGARSRGAATWWW